MEDEVLEVDEFALNPERGDRVVEVGPFDPALTDGRMRDTLVEAGENLGRPRGRCRFYFPISIGRKPAFASVCALTRA